MIRFRSVGLVAALVLSVGACRSTPPVSAPQPATQEEMAKLIGAALAVAEQGQAIRKEAQAQGAVAAKAVDAAHEVSKGAREQVKGRTGGTLPVLGDDANDHRLMAMQDHVLTSVHLELGDVAGMAAARVEDPKEREQLQTRAMESRRRALEQGGDASNEVLAVMLESQGDVVASTIHRHDALHAPVYEAPTEPSSAQPTAPLRAHEALPAEVSIETAGGARRARFYKNAVRIDAVDAKVPEVTIHYRSGPETHDGWATVRTEDVYVAFFPEKRQCGLNRLGSWCTLSGSTMAFVMPSGAIWFQRSDGYEVVELGPQGRVRFAPGGDEAVVTLPGRGTFRVAGIKSDAPRSEPPK